MPDLSFSSKFKLSVVMIVFLAFTLAACEQLPGEGGTSEITGKVFVNEYNESNVLFNQYYVGDERVYIIFGDDTIFDEETRTSYDGSYKFPFLRKGTYKIYVYSDCLTCDGGTQAVFAEVEITKNNSTVSVPDIVIDKRN